MRKLLLSLSLAVLFVASSWAQTCQIGSKTFNRLFDAVNDAPYDGTPTTITMIADETFLDWDITVMNGRNVIVDLNGKQLHMASFSTFSDCSLTIKDNTNAGRLLIRCDIYNEGYALIEGGTIEFEGAEENKGGYLISNTAGGTMQIKGGSFLYTKGSGCMIDNCGNFTISGGEFTADGEYAAVQNRTNGNLTISGGTFTHLGTGSNVEWDYRRVLWTAEGSTTTITGGTFIGNGASQTLCFNGDATISNATVIANEKWQGQALGCWTNSKVTINSGTFTAGSNNNSGNVVGDNARLTVNGGTFECTGPWSVLYINENCFAQLNGGIFISHSTQTYQNNANTIACYGQLMLIDANGDLSISSVGGGNGCLYVGGNSYVGILGGKLKAKNAENIYGYIGHVSVCGGLFSNINTFANGGTHGYYTVNEDATTRDEYPVLVELLPLNHVDKVWLRNVKTGRYLGAGDGGLWNSQAISQKDGLCLDMLDVANGKYVAFFSKVLNSFGYYTLGGSMILHTNSLLGGDAYSNYGVNHLWTDRPAGNSIFVKTEVRPGVYTLRLKDYGYLGEKDGVIYNNLTDANDEAAQWEIVTYADKQASLAMATVDNPVDATQFVANTDFLPNYWRHSIADTDFGNVFAQPWEGTFNTNNDIETYIDGNYRWNYLSINARRFNVHQTVTDLPNGVYIVSCQGFYRNGSTASSVVTKRNRGTEKLYVKLCANDAEVELKSILDGAVESSIADGSTKVTLGWVPKELGSLSAYFDAGLYTNNLVAKVTDGTLTLGFKNLEQSVTGDWAVMDRVRLTYYGNAEGTYESLVTGIDEVVTEATVNITPKAYYDLNGNQINAPKSGINLIRMSDGSVRKIFVK